MEPEYGALGVGKSMSHKAPVYVDPDTDEVFYRASALGYCQFDLVCHRMGMAAESTPKFLEKAFAAGHANEERILDIMKQKHLIPLLGHSQKEVKHEVLPGIWIVGHIDDETSDAVVDAKAFSDKTYQMWRDGSWEAFPHYAVQQVIYAHLLGHSWVWMGIGLKDEAGIVQEVRPEIFNVKDIPVSWEQILGYVKSIEDYALAGEWPQTDCEDRICSFAYKRKEINTFVYDDDEFDKLIEEWNAINTDEKVAQKKRKALNEQIFAKIDTWNKKGKRLASKRWEIKDVVVNGTVVDMEKLKAEVDVKSFLKPKAESRFIKVNAVSGEDDD